ncbi:MAG: dephospho-CoA kinase, partial [Acidimicrobiales bacterium]
MLAVSLTGGIGSGKSTVADLLVDRGAVLVDADHVAREVVEPGAAAYKQLVDRFGESILAEDETIDRKALAAIAFADQEQLDALNAITHPVIGARMIELKRAQEGTDHVVLLDIPLLKPLHRELLGLDLVIVVDCPVDGAVERLVSQRGFDRQDARARVGAQISRQERLAGADVVIDNSGGREELASKVDGLWARLMDLELAKRTGDQR